MTVRFDEGAARLRRRDRASAPIGLDEAGSRRLAGREGASVRPAMAGADKAAFVRGDDRLDAIPEAEFGEDPGHMGLDCGFAHEQFLRDLRVGQPARHGPQHVPQAVGLRRAKVIPLWAAIVVIAATVAIAALGSTPISAAVWALGLVTRLAPAAYHMARQPVETKAATVAARLEPAV